MANVVNIHIKRHYLIFYFVLFLSVYTAWMRCESELSNVKRLRGPSLFMEGGLKIYGTEMM